VSIADSLSGSVPVSSSTRSSRPCWAWATRKPPVTSPRRPYATDLTDAEWQLLAPLTPAAKPGGRPPSHERRELVKNKLAPAWQSAELDVHHDRGVCGQADQLQDPTPAAS
jgi:hypothetical protein